MTKARFQIDVRWPRAPTPDATDVAHLSLRAGNHTLTLLAEVEAGRLRNYFRASAVTLGNGILPREILEQRLEAA